MKKIIISLFLLLVLVVAVSGIVIGLGLGTLALVNVNPQWETPLPLGENQFVPEFYWDDGAPSSGIGDSTYRQIVKDLNLDPSYDDKYPIYNSVVLSEKEVGGGGFCNYDKYVVIGNQDYKEVGRSYKVFTPAKFPYLYSTVNKKPGAVYMEGAVIVKIETRSTGIGTDPMRTCIGWAKTFKRISLEEYNKIK